MSKTIPLTRGLVAIVDDEDYEWLSQYNWHAQRSGQRWYAMQRGGIAMHRWVMRTPPGMHTDHISGEGLDNRRANLRIVTCAQNLHNRTRKQAGCTARFHGVNWDKDSKCWRARIMRNGRRVSLGNFDCEYAAAGAYDAAGIASDPEHFTPNFSASWLAP